MGRHFISTLDGEGPLSQRVTIRPRDADLTPRGMIIQRLLSASSVQVGPVIRGIKNGCDLPFPGFHAYIVAN